MLINRTELVEHIGKLYYQGKPYNGGIFYLTSEIGVLENIRQIKDGLDVGPYDNGYIYLDGNPMYLDSEAWDDDPGDTGIKYKGETYTGFVCDLDKENKFCEYMEAVKNGERGEHVMFYRSGSLRGVGWKRKDKGWDESYGWFEDGNLSGCTLRILETRKNVLKLTLQEPRKISYLKLRSEYFDFVTHHIGKFRFSLPFESIQDFFQYSTASKLVLTGEGVTDKLINYLSTNDGFSFLKKIVVRSNSLSEQTILSFSNISTLESISLDGGGYESDKHLLPAYVSLAEALKRKRPECAVILNSRIVNLSEGIEWYKTYR